MGFKANHVSVENKELSHSIPNEIIETEELTKQELEILLRVLADADLKGREVEHFYNLIIKLQNLYIKK
jgi:hypothetical protein